MGSRTYSFDANMVLSDGANAITSDGYSLNGGIDGIIDLGGNQSVTPAQQARIDAALVVDVTAIDIASTDELYRLKLLGCNSSDFSSGVRALGEMTLGDGSTMVPSTQTDSGTGRYEILFTNEQDDTIYQYLKLYVDVNGTSTSITFKAFVAPLPKM